ncbi:MAG: radical SAM protein [Vulcanimicrobiota bacterium]
MAKVMFFNPPRRADGAQTLFNNATLTLASFLQRGGVEARTEPLDGPYWIDKMIQVLEDYRPDTVAVSCKWWDTLYGATEVARLVRRYHPPARLVSGGQTATSFAPELVARTQFDAVVRGDGEKPLLDYALGAPSCNLTSAEAVLPTTYVQQNDDGQNLRLADDLTALADPDVLEMIGFNAPFIWTGKGCRCTCMFCAGSALGHKRMFGRKGYLYRPFDDVLHDMQVLEPWSKGTYLFDFDPIADPGKGDYYRQLFEQLPRGRYHVAFYFWSLPEVEFVHFLADRFASAFISLDAQSLSQEVRQRLAERRQLKPYAPNSAFEEVLAAIASHPNLDAGLYGILGLPTEEPQHVLEAEAWIGHLLSTFGPAIGELAVTPLSIEPGALMDRDPDKYGMVVTRKTFDDYLAFTRSSFHSRERIHNQTYDPNLPHPYGCHQTHQRPDRVYHDFHRLTSRLKATFDQWAQNRAQQGLRYFPRQLKLTIQNRNWLRHQWHLVVWAAGLALERKLPELEVDARQAFVFMPGAPALRRTGSHAYTSERLPGFAQAIASGQLKVRILARPDQNWGAIAEAGAELVYD